MPEEIKEVKKELTQEDKELRISQLEQRIEKINEQLARAQAAQESKATIPALNDEKRKIMEESVKIYGDLSPFYGKV